MIIKRWNGSAFVAEYPKTTTAHVFTADGVNQIFSSNKILPAYLPDSVFDNLKFQVALSAAASAGTIADAILNARADAESIGNVQSVKGMYFVISTGGTITGVTNQNGAVDNPTIYATLTFRPQDGGSNATANTSSGVLEVGDWFVIEEITGGNGTNGNPYVFVASVINNSYELASTTVDGVVRLSSRTTYASLSGDNAITETVLKTVIDNASFASSTHVHGNITNAGAIGSTSDLVVVTGASGVLTTASRSGIDSRSTFTPSAHTHGDISNTGAITSTAITPATGDHIILSDASGSDVLKRGISIGTGTTTYLRNDGTWGTPVGTTYAEATTTTLGLVELAFAKLGSSPTLTETTTAGRYYGVSLNSNSQMQVNVPWTDTTYSAGEGITLSSTTFRMTYPFYVQTATPTTSITGTIWYDIN